MSQAARLKQDAGFAPVGVGINIKDGTFNGIDYVTRFEMQNGSGRRADLKGYVLQTIPGATKINADGSEVTSGGTITFNVYFVEKLFTVSYDLGADVLGNACPPTVGTPADKTVAWNSSNLYPVTTPVWEGYKAPKWQYKNATGTWTVVPTNAKLCDIAVNDDNTNPIVLKALWESDVVRLVFNAQVGGIIKSTDGTITVPSGGSKYKDIDAVTGPAPTVKVTVADGYVFLGWYKDGVKLTEDESYTVTAVDGLFTSGTYEAHFRALSSHQLQHQALLRGRLQPRHLRREARAARGPFRPGELRGQRLQRHGQARQGLHPCHRHPGREAPHRRPGRWRGTAPVLSRERA